MNVLYDFIDTFELNDNRVIGISLLLLDVDAMFAVCTLNI